eukprot:7979331-Pyramimonas_sp.AAC.1
MSAAPASSAERPAALQKTPSRGGPATEKGLRRHLTQAYSGRAAQHPTKQAPRHRPTQLGQPNGLT